MHSEIFDVDRHVLHARTVSMTDHWQYLSGHAPGCRSAFDELSVDIADDGWISACSMGNLPQRGPFGKRCGWANKLIILRIQR